MDTVLERNTSEDVEMKQHNAMIGENYRMLFDIVEEQFSSPAVEERGYETTVVEPKAPAYDVTPTVEQTPTVTQYVPVRPVETTRVETVMPVRQIQTQVQVRTQVQAKPVVQAQYSLTPFAKVMMAVFALVVTAMLVLIGVNSALMRQGQVRLQDLETQKQELIVRSQELQKRIQELRTEESILERAEQAGLLKGE